MGMGEKRSFTVVMATRTDGCNTKYAVKGHGGRFISRTPDGAARKAFSRLCHKKRIRGQCALNITVLETTQGSSGKAFTYKLSRHKLDTPVERNGFVIEYETRAKSITGQPSDCSSGKHKSSGPMLKHSVKRTTMSSKKSLKRSTKH